MLRDLEACHKAATVGRAQKRSFLASFIGGATNGRGFMAPLLQQSTVPDITTN
jgi:hypothetical protein